MKYYSCDTIKKLGWEGHVTRKENRRGAYRVLDGNLRERDYLEDLCLDAKIILKWTFSKWNGEA
jgi:hypothetical protein